MILIPTGTVIVSVRHHLRGLLDSKLRTDADLENFCLVFYPEIQRNFSSGMNRKQKFNLLLESIDIGELNNKLHDYLREYKKLPKQKRLPTLRRRNGKSRFHFRDFLLGGLLADQLRRLIDWSHEFWLSLSGWLSALAGLSKVALTTTGVVGLIVVGVAVQAVGRDDAAPSPAAAAAPLREKSSSGRPRVTKEPPGQSRTASPDDTPIPESAMALALPAVGTGAAAPPVTVLIPADPAAVAPPKSATADRAPAIPSTRTSHELRKRTRHRSFSAVPLLPDLDLDHNIGPAPAKSSRPASQQGIPR